jgi:hypothetical protein
MDDRTIPDGITLTATNVDVNYSPAGARVNIHFNITIGEEFAVARADADIITSEITDMIAKYLIDYAADGQEVE